MKVNAGKNREVLINENKVLLSHTIHAGERRQPKTLAFRHKKRSVLTKFAMLLNEARQQPNIHDLSKPYI